MLISYILLSSCFQKSNCNAVSYWKFLFIIIFSFKGSSGAFVRITREHQAEIDAANIIEEEVVNFNCQSLSQQVKNLVPQSMRLYRDTIRRAVNNYTNEEIAQWSADEATIRLNRIEEAWSKFEAEWPLLGQQQQLTEEQLAGCSAFLADAEEEYLSYKFKLRRQISSIESVTTLARPSEVSPIQIQISDPPRIPKFSGLESDWANFRAIFEAEVHCKSKFSNSQKNAISLRSATRSS